ncbi:YhcH/YjgK/YiaL family protein [Stieleria sp. JC731]|uniref:YhcH/YjgK/YiaL family protein n=1 Tax=Pirellulaceae TaxID=2691357 RepID=UPI001E30B5D4|nr:YhcH/YjgK/YiaL family protein [Stieleria sp. JC731]MCC9603607.1 YhcH/YjgK/YiaL family protein [Stieleria sp. JC731]
MIISTLADASRYTPLHSRFAEAFRYLETVRANELVEGKHEIAGDDLFAIAWSGIGKGQSESVLESHRRYIDIQYVVTGFDVMGWRPLADCQRIRDAYDETKDLAFFHDQPTSWTRVSAGSFAIFYPEDVHAPLGTTTSLKKVVVKVRVDG